MTKLTSADVAKIIGMLRRGDKQHDIAAYFGVNGGRVAEIAARRPFANPKRVVPIFLPRSGPYDIPGMERDRLTLKRRAAAAVTGIEQACADIEKKVPPEVRKNITSELERLMHGAELLERPL